jgi:uncharacterized membrane protein YeiH
MPTTRRELEDDRLSAAVQLPATLNSDLVLGVLEPAAVIASAIAGMIVASGKRMDFVGTFALACVNAFGGGTVRDLLLDNRPFYWAEHWPYLVAILVLCVPFVYSERAFHITTELHRRSEKMDAVGLALFAIAGTGIALDRGAPLVVAMLMGVVTGTAGGVMRDVVVNDVPDLFRPGALYATAAFAGSAAFIACIEQDVSYPHAALAGTVVVFGLRLLSLRTGLTIPQPQWIERRDKT